MFHGKRGLIKYNLLYASLCSWKKFSELSNFMIFNSDFWDFWARVGLYKDQTCPGANLATHLAAGDRKLRAVHTCPINLIFILWLKMDTVSFIGNLDKTSLKHQSSAVKNNCSWRKLVCSLSIKPIIILIKPIINDYIIIDQKIALWATSYGLKSGCISDP